MSGTTAEPRTRFENEIPEAVRNADLAADELHARLYAQQGQDEPPPEPPPGDDAGTTEVVLAPMERPQQPPQPPQAEPQPPADNSGVDWESRYKAMEGRYKAEIPRLQRQFEEALAQNEGLRTLLAQLNDKVQAAPQPDPYAQQVFLTNEDVETYGSEMLDVTKRAAQEAVTPYIRQLQEELQALRGQVGTVYNGVQQRTRSEMYEVLNREVPNWREVQQTPEFLEWVDSPDAYSNRPRRALMQEALDNMDGGWVSRILKGFLSEMNALAPPAVQPTGGQPPAGGEPPRPRLDDFAAPGRARPAPRAPNGAEGGKRMYTSLEITQFYDDQAKGKWVGREAEAAQLDADMVAAAREGRIR